MVTEKRGLRGTGELESIQEIPPPLALKSRSSQSQVKDYDVRESVSLDYSIYSDELLSSSPIAHSTPKNDDGPTNDKSTRSSRTNFSGSQTIFGVDSFRGSLDEISTSTGADILKRRNSQAREAGATMRAKLPKMVRERLSPKQPKTSEQSQDRAELQGALEPVDVGQKNRGRFSFVGTKPKIVLSVTNLDVRQQQDPIGKVQESKHTLKRTDPFSKVANRPEARKPMGFVRRASLFFKSPSEQQIEQTKPTEHEHTEHQMGTVEEDVDSMMDTDELQWEDPEYNIGMRKA